MMHKASYPLAVLLVGLPLWFLTRPVYSAKAAATAAPVNVVLSSGTTTSIGGTVNIGGSQPFDISLSHGLGIYASCPSGCSGVSANLLISTPVGTEAVVAIPQVSPGTQYVDLEGPRGANSAQLLFSDSSSSNASVNWVVLSRAS